MRVGRGRRFRKLTPPAAGETGATRNLCHPQLVPPFSSDRRQTGATPGFAPVNPVPKQCHPSVRARNRATLQFGSQPDWCHPRVRLAGSSPADSAGKLNTGKLGPPPNPLGPESGPPVSSSPTAKTVPPVGLSPAGSVRKPETEPETEPPVSSEASYGQLVPPVSSEHRQTGATRRFVSGRFGREARNNATPLLVFQDGATRQFARVSLPNVWCHPPIRGAVVASSLRACPPRVAPVRPLLSPPGLHPPPLTVLAGDPERKASRLKKLFTTSR